MTLFHLSAEWPRFFHATLAVTDATELTVRVLNVVGLEPLGTTRVAASLDIDPLFRRSSQVEDCIVLVVCELVFTNFELATAFHDSIKSRLVA